MKKTVLCSLLISAGLLSSSSFAATNPCIATLDSRVNEGTLIVPGCNLNDSDMPQLISYLTNHANINTLLAYDNNISQGAAQLAQVPSLTTMYLASNQIGDESAKALANDPNLMFLDIGYNKLHDQSAKYFANNSKLEELAIYGNQITDSGMQALAKGSFIALALSTTAINYETAVALATNPKLQSLTFFESNLNDIKSIRTLTQSTSIIDFEFYSGNLSDSALQIVANDNSLQSLAISNMPVSTADIAAFAKNPTLKELELNNDFLNDASVQALTTSHLQNIYLYDNWLGDATAEAFSTNTFLNTLVLGNNHIGDAGAEALAKNTTLNFLDLSFNLIGNAGMAALAKSTIAVINAYGNPGSTALHKTAPHAYCFDKTKKFCPNYFMHLKK